MRSGMMSVLLAAIAGIVLPFQAASAGPAPRTLKVSENRRFLVQDDGKPFFYLGDTAWELFHRLNREHAELYLKDRAAKGYTVIQAVVLAEFGGLTEPTPYGHLPLLNNDPAKPQEAYFEHVDWVVNKANELGLVVAMLPTWGDKVNKKWGQGPEIFTPANAGPYGEFLGKRYKDKSIIWMLGGDRPVEKAEHLEIWRNMAAGLKRGDGGAHLMTYHPMGRSTSSAKLHNESWLDFNTFQSGHGQKDGANWDMLKTDYNLQPTKPAMDSEPNYDNHPVRNKNAKGQWFDEHDVRKAAYRSLFAGAFGHTYGCHDIWQFHELGRKNLTDARTGWRQAISLPGAAQMGYARRLIESRPFLSRIPDQSLIVGDAGTGADHAQATRDSDGTYAMVYFPRIREITVDLTKVKGPLRLTWWNPRTGKSAAVIGEATGDKPQAFTPPAAEAAAVGDDWVLLIDAAAKKYPLD